MEIEKSEKNETPYFWGISYMRQNLSPRISNKDFNFSSFSLPNLILTETLKKCEIFFVLKETLNPWCWPQNRHRESGPPNVLSLLEKITCWSPAQSAGKSSNIGWRGNGGNKLIGGKCGKILSSHVFHGSLVDPALHNQIPAWYISCVAFH